MKPSIAVGLGEAAFGENGQELVAYGLGSCVALALWCPARRFGVLCHVVLPDSNGQAAGASTPAKYADHAVVWAFSQMTSRGVRLDQIVAKVAGGAHVLPLPMASEIGRRNAETTIAILAERRVKVAATSTGGTKGRTVRFDPETGVLKVSSVGGTEVQL